jgi:hypothetical protein
VDDVEAEDTARRQIGRGDRRADEENGDRDVRDRVAGAMP